MNSPNPLNPSKVTLQIGVHRHEDGTPEVWLGGGEDREAWRQLQAVVGALFGWCDPTEPDGVRFEQSPRQGCWVSRSYSRILMVEIRAGRQKHEPEPNVDNVWIAPIPAGLQRRYAGNVGEA